MATLMEALAFAARVIDIFPMDLGSKRPSISFIEQATHDPEKIKLLWRDPITGTKDYNIGVLCGGANRLIIADIDTKYDDKFKRSAIANYKAMGGHFNTLVIKTASGGLQVYFRLPPGKTYINMQNVVPGVDIRCEHGYGIGPGSFSIESGGSYEIYIDMEIADLPEVIIPLLKPIKTRKERFNGHADTDKAIVLYTDYLQRVDPAIEGQGGDQHTYNVACMGVRDYGLSEPTTTALMLEFFNPRCEPPWDADELQHKVENAESYAIGQAGSRDPDNLVNGLSYVPAAPTQTIANRYENLKILSNVGKVKWLATNLLIQGEVTIIAGPGNVGKSTWMLALGCHMVLGRDFEQHIIKQSGDVLTYNPEDTREIMSARIECLCSAYSMDFNHVTQHFDIISQDNPHYVFAERVNNNSKMTIPEDTERYFSDYKNEHPECKLIVVDPLRKMLRGINENDNAQMSEAMNCLNMFARKLDVSLAICHHVPKNLMQRKDLDPDSPDLSVGAGSVVSSARVVINVLPQTDTDIAIQGQNKYYFSSRVAKNNWGERGFLTWWQRKLVMYRNGDSYTVTIPMNIKSTTALTHRMYLNAIGDRMTEFDKNDLTVTQAGLIVHELYGDGRSIRTINDLIRTIFKRGATTHPYTDITNGRQYMMALDGEEKKQRITLIEISATQPLPPALTLPEYKEEKNDDSVQ